MNFKGVTALLLTSAVASSCDPGHTLISDACTPCTEGKFALERGTVGVEGCLLCPAGKFAQQQGQLSCTPCQRGMYVATKGNKVCQACPVGSISAIDGGSICTTCDPGETSVATGHVGTSCAKCAKGRGTVSGEACQDNTDSVRCPTGYMLMQENIGLSSCTICKPLTGTASTLCVPCVQNFTPSFIANGLGLEKCTKTCIQLSLDVDVLHAKQVVLDDLKVEKSNLKFMNECNESLLQNKSLGLCGYSECNELLIRATGLDANIMMMFGIISLTFVVSFSFAVLVRVIVQTETFQIWLEKKKKTKIPPAREEEEKDSDDDDDDKVEAKKVGLQRTNTMIARERVQRRRSKDVGLNQAELL